MQAKLRDLERQKTELENTEYVAIVRSLNLTPQQLSEFLKNQQPFPMTDSGADAPLPEQEDQTYEE